MTDIDVEPTRVYHLADAAELIAESGIDLDEPAEADGHIMFAFVRATEPTAI